MSEKNIVKFRRKPRWRRHIRLPRIPTVTLFLILPIIVLFAIVITESPDPDLVCYNPYVFDGDTLECDGERVRLVGIDAPEMPGHCRPGRKCVQGDPDAAKDYLESLAAGLVKCVSQGVDHYGRTLGRCEADGVDFSCAMIKAGHAERRYGNIICR